jgi:hypothetical protein
VWLKKMLVRGTRIVLPRVLHKQTLILALEGHMGMVSMKQILQTKVWWKTMLKDVEDWCRSCHEFSWWQVLLCWNLCSVQCYPKGCGRPLAWTF